MKTWLTALKLTFVSPLISRILFVAYVLLSFVFSIEGELFLVFIYLVFIAIMEVKALKQILSLERAFLAPHFRVFYLARSLVIAVVASIPFSLAMLIFHKVNLLHAWSFCFGMYVLILGFAYYKNGEFSVFFILGSFIFLFFDFNVPLADVLPQHAALALLYFPGAALIYYLINQSMLASELQEKSSNSNFGLNAFLWQSQSKDNFISDVLRQRSNFSLIKYIYNYLLPKVVLLPGIFRVLAVYGAEGILMPLGSLFALLLLFFISFLIQFFNGPLEIVLLSLLLLLIFIASPCLFEVSDNRSRIIQYWLQSKEKNRVSFMRNIAFVQTFRVLFTGTSTVCPLRYS